MQKVANTGFAIRKKQPGRKAGVALTDASAGLQGVNDSRTLLLDSAEIVFAERGFVPATTREICLRVDLNQALIHYYFGTKIKLFEEVVARRANAIVNERLRLLDEVREEAGEHPPTLEKLLYCFVAPPLQIANASPGGQAFARILARLHHDPISSTRDLIDSIYTSSTRVFAHVLARNLPELPVETIFWRLSFAIGAYQQTLSHSGRLEAISEGRCRSTDVDTATAEMITFLAGGFCAAPTSRTVEIGASGNGISVKLNAGRGTTALERELPGQI